MNEDIFVDMTIPGWISKEEITSICHYISKTNPKKILEAGPFGGRLTASLCKTFPTKDITVVDCFHYKDTKLTKEFADSLYFSLGKEFEGCNLTLDFFKKLHTYPNLNIIDSNYIDHKEKYDLTILSITVGHGVLDATWEMVFNHALLHSKTVIGNLDSLGNPQKEGRKFLTSNYNIEIFDADCYILKNKK